MNLTKIMLVLPLPGGCLSTAKQMAASDVPGVAIHAFDTVHELKKIAAGAQKLTLDWGNVRGKLNAALISSFEALRPDLFLTVAFSAVTIEVIEHIKKRSTPTAHWLIEDFRLAPSSPLAVSWIDVAGGYDYFFTIQSGGFAGLAKSMGVRKCHYLPLGCNPATHKKAEIGAAQRAFYGSDVAFVGAPYPNRVKLFSSLVHLDLGVWGAGWLSITESGWGAEEINGQLLKRVRGDNRWIDEDEASLIYNASKISLNPHSSLNEDGPSLNRDFLNPRLFALAGCSAFQIADYREPLKEAFEIGSEIVVWDDAQQLPSLIDHYLNEPQERVEMGRRAGLRAYEQHTYRHRIETIVSIIF